MSTNYATGMNAAKQYSIETDKLNLWYAKFQALINVSVQIKHGIITGLIGPSGCGKSTLLRCFNRVNERYGYVTTTGEIKILGKNIYDPDVSLTELRKAVGMAEAMFDSVSVIVAVTVALPSNTTSLTLTLVTTGGVVSGVGPATQFKAPISTLSISAPSS